MKSGVFKKLGIAAALIALIWFGVRFIIPLSLPFLIAWIAAICLQPPLKLLSNRLGVGRRPLAGIFVALTVIGIGMLVFLLISRVASEAIGFFSDISVGADGFFDTLEGALKRIPFVSSLNAALFDALAEAVKGMLSSVTSALPSVISAIIGALPGAILFAVILIMASYYFAADYDGIKAKVYSMLPPKAQNGWDGFKGRLIGVGVRYMKSCIALAFITFTELLVGFLTLGIPYAFTLALLIALLDMLPILGAGTALIPWAIWEWATGNGYYAIGLLIIFAVVTVVRRFAEPRIISSGIGLSPITTLISMYVGFKLWGLGGLIIAPLVTVIILSALPREISEKLGMNDTESKEELRKRRYKVKNI